MRRVSNCEHERQTTAAALVSAQDCRHPSHMPPTPPTVLYVHGAGHQPPADAWLPSHDAALFAGRRRLPSDVAYFADIVEAAMDLPGRDDDGGDDGGADRADHDEDDDGLPPVHASLRSAPGEAAAHGFLFRLAGAMGPLDFRGRIGLPSVGIPAGMREFYRGVSGYLLGEPVLAEGIRDRVRDAVRRNPGPLVIVAHSLGSVIVFDVMGEEEFASRQVVFISVGTALGLAPAQERLMAYRSERPIPLPAGIAIWRNFHSARDVVAMGSALDDLHADFAPAERIHSTEVRNLAEFHHSFDGYLATPEVRDAVYAHLAAHPAHAASGADEDQAD